MQGFGEKVQLELTHNKPFTLTQDCSTLVSATVHVADLTVSPLPGVGTLGKPGLST